MAKFDLLDKTGLLIVLSVAAAVSSVIGQKVEAKRIDINEPTPIVTEAAQKSAEETILEHLDNAAYSLDRHIRESKASQVEITLIEKADEENTWKADLYGKNTFVTVPETATFTPGTKITLECDAVKNLLRSGDLYQIEKSSLEEHFKEIGAEVVLFGGQTQLEIESEEDLEAGDNIDFD